MGDLEFQTECLLSSESDPNKSTTLSPGGQNYGFLWPSIVLAGFAQQLVINTQQLGTAILGYRFLSGDFCLHVPLTLIWSESSGSKIVAPGPASSALALPGGNLLGVQILRFHCRPAESEKQRMGQLSKLGFSKLSCTLKFITSVKGKWANSCQGPLCAYRARLWYPLLYNRG